MKFHPRDSLGPKEALSTCSSIITADAGYSEITTRYGIVLKFQATAVAFGTPRSLPSTEARRAQEHIYEP